MIENGRFERLYESHAPGLLAFLMYRVGDRALAEDLVADTFERVLRSHKRFNWRRGSEKTWIYAIALNRLRDVLRKQSGEVRALERVGAPPPSGELPDVAQRADVLSALDTLSEEEREVVALRYGADLTVPEISRVLRQPLTTVEGRLYRGLRKLRGTLTP